MTHRPFAPASMPSARAPASQDRARLHGRGDSLLPDLPGGKRRGPGARPGGRGGGRLVRCDAAAVRGDAPCRTSRHGAAAGLSRSGVGTAASAGSAGPRAFGRTCLRVELEVFASNVAAIRLYEQERFVTEGRKRRGRILDGADDDILVMGLLREEWPGMVRCGSMISKKIGRAVEFRGCGTTRSAGRTKPNGETPCNS